MISNVGTFTIFTQVEKDLLCIRDSKGVQWSMLSSKSMCCTFSICCTIECARENVCSASVYLPSNVSFKTPTRWLLESDNMYINIIINNMYMNIIINIMYMKIMYV